jgi:fumarate reductase subunit D
MLIGKRNVILTDADLHRSQEHLQPAIDWNYFIVNYAVDGAHVIVRPPLVVLIAVSLPVLGSIPFRDLYNNQLSGTLTSHIGRLTALNGLCVVDLNDSFSPELDCAGHWKKINSMAQFQKKLAN